MNWLKPKCKVSDKIALIDKMYSGCYFLVKVIKNSHNKQHLQLVCNMADSYNDMISTQIDLFRKSTTSDIRDSFNFCLDEISKTLKDRYAELYPAKPPKEYKDPCVVRGFAGMAKN